MNHFSKPSPSNLPQRQPNRLAGEASPYLQQHAYNPVAWYPWGDEAIAAARTQDKPIFLSIGYSTCHWCHVMERESFEDEPTAAVLNEHYIAIKVDREERPDVDRVYMTAVQALTGSGGWPLSAWLSTDLKPFYGGTYFPPVKRYGQPAFRDVLLQLANLWRTERPRILESSAHIHAVLEQAHTTSGQDTGEIDAASLAEEAVQDFARTFDSQWGGFGSAPKFPRPAALTFLLEQASRTGSPEAAAMAKRTLDRMAEGGIRDLLGGGFHRYSVDRYWRVPHFEKMLYDQGQLLTSFSEAFRLTGEERYRSTALDIFRYLRNDLAAPQGGFYSAEDADSPVFDVKEGKASSDQQLEGAFYLWTVEEVANLLGPTDAVLFNQRFGLEPEGNTLNDPHDEFGRGNVLYEATARPDPTKDTERADLEAAWLQRLAESRRHRPRPSLDDKILVSWNGLAISGLAHLANSLSDSEPAAAAANAARFLLRELVVPDNENDRPGCGERSARGIGLKRRFRRGSVEHEGQLDDYVYFASGLLDLYSATLEIQWLDQAAAMIDSFVERFSDPRAGGFFDSPSNPHILIRTKEATDGAEPSPNGMAALLLTRAGTLVDRFDWIELARTTVEHFAPWISRQPTACPTLLRAALRIENPPPHVVIRGDENDQEGRALLQVASNTFFVRDSLLWLQTAAAPPYAGDTVAAMAAAPQPCAWVCSGRTCGPPLHTARQLEQALHHVEETPNLVNRPSDSA